MSHLDKTDSKLQIFLIRNVNNANSSSDAIVSTWNIYFCKSSWRLSRLISFINSQDTDHNEHGYHSISVGGPIREGLPAWCAPDLPRDHHSTNNPHVRWLVDYLQVYKPQTRTILSFEAWVPRQHSAYLRHRATLDIKLYFNFPSDDKISEIHSLKNTSNRR